MAAVARRNCGDRRLSDGLRQPRPHRHEDQTIVPPKTFGAAHGLQKKNGKEVTFKKRTAPRTEARATAAIVAVKFEIPLEPELVRGVICHSTPRNHETSKGERPIGIILPQARRMQRLACPRVYPFRNACRTCKAACPRANVRRSRVSHDLRDNVTFIHGPKGFRL